MWRKIVSGIYFAVFFILFAVLFKQTEGTAVIANEVKKENPFNKEETKIFFGTNTMFNEKYKFTSFGSPVLFNVGDTVVAMAEAHFNDNNKVCSSIVAAVIDKNKEWGKVSALLRNCSEEKKNLKFLLNPTVTVNNNNEVSVIFAGYSSEDDLKKKINANDLSWEPLTASGTVVDDNNNDGTQRSKYFKWKEKVQPLRENFSFNKDKFKQKFQKKIYFLKHFVGGGGVGIKTGNKYMLPLQGMTNNKNISFTMAFLDSKKDLQFLSKDDGIENCIDPAIISLDEKNIFIITSCGKGHYTICKYITNYEEWDCSKETLSGMWGNNKERTGYGVRAGFTNAVIEEKNVALFTQPMQEENSDHNKLHLWMTDMTHSYDLGQISADYENVKASSLLYKKEKRGADGKIEEEEKLYCLYEVDKHETNDIVFVDITTKLEQTKNILKKWKEADEKIVSVLCSYEKKIILPGNSQKDFVPTMNLVSYFSDQLTEKGEWKDEYLHMNATITGKTQKTAENNGFRLSGIGAGAKWLVKTNKQNYPYYFANYEFTFIATITIHEVLTEKKIPLLGLVLIDESGEKKRVGLLYTKGNKWSVTHEEEEDDENIEEYKKCEIAVPYQVTISVSDEEFILYINGERFNDYSEEVSELFINKKYVSYIYFGADDEKTDIDSTITNVFIYSRAINEGSDKLRSSKEFCKDTPPAVSVDNRQSLEQGNQNEKNEVSTENVEASEKTINEINEFEGSAQKESSLKISSTSLTEHQQEMQQQPTTTPPLATQSQSSEENQEQQSQQTSAPQLEKETEKNTTNIKDKEQEKSAEEEVSKEKELELSAETSLQNENTNAVQDIQSQNDISENHLHTNVEEEQQINIGGEEEDNNLKEGSDNKNTSSEFPSVQNLTVLISETTNQSNNINVNSSQNSELNYTQLSEQVESTQSPAPTAQKEKNTTQNNISDVLAMISINNSSGDGTVHVRISLVLLLTGLLSFFVVFY